MIVRLLTGRVPPEKLDSFHEQARLALESARQSPGLLHGELGRQIRPDCAEDVVFLTTWRDLASLYAWIGRNDLLASPLLDEGDETLFSRLEVQHYEALDDLHADGNPDAVTPATAGER